MQHLIALAGLSARAKVLAAQQIAAHFAQSGTALTVIDNADVPLHIETVRTIRLASGCVCCALAPGLYRAVHPLDTPAILVVASARAEPASLAQVLGNLRTPARRITTLTIGQSDLSNAVETLKRVLRE